MINELEDRLNEKTWTTQQLDEMEQAELKLLAAVSKPMREFVHAMLQIDGVEQHNAVWALLQPLLTEVLAHPSCSNTSFDVVKQRIPILLRGLKANRDIFDDFNRTFKSVQRH